MPCGHLAGLVRYSIAYVASSGLGLCIEDFGGLIVMIRFYI